MFVDEYMICFEPPDRMLFVKKFVKAPHRACQLVLYATHVFESLEIVVDKLVVEFVYVVAALALFGRGDVILNRD